MRVDLFYESFPRTWLSGCSIDETIGKLDDMVRAGRRCCTDAPMTLEVMDRKGLDHFRLPGFGLVLECVDRDDSAISIVETERQHGRGRVEHPPLKSCFPNIVYGAV